MLKSTGAFAAIIKVMGLSVLAECDHPRGCVNLRLRASDQVHVGEITLPLAYKHLNALLQGNPLANTMFQAHASRWVSDVMARVNVASNSKPDPVPPACLFQADGFQVVVTPEVDVCLVGKPMPSITVRTYVPSLQQFMEHSRCFEFNETGISERDAIFEQVWKSKSITPVYDLWVDVLSMIEAEKAVCGMR